MNPIPSSNPYVGPRPFEKEDGDRFFGRERETQDLTALVRSERLVLFYAQSGAGKSSLINTRLIPNLEALDFAVLPVGRISNQTGERQKGKNFFIYNLLLSLERSGKSAGPNPGPSNTNPNLSTMTLARYLKLLPVEDVPAPERADAAGKYVPPVYAMTGGIQPLVLIIDQFEELFTTHLEAWEQREPFFKQIEEAMERDPSLWVVLVMREDYLASLTPYLHLFPDRLRVRYYMERMDCAAALEAIQEPVKDQRPFEAGVAEELVNNLRLINVGKTEQDRPIYEPGQYVEPVQLQVVCYQLWESLKNFPGPNITRENLRGLAKGQSMEAFIRDSLANYYEQALREVLAQYSQITERQLRDFFSIQLITENEMRGIIRQGRFQAENAPHYLPDEVINALQDRFIIRAESRGGNTWYELSHDHFVAPILQSNRAWMAKNPRLVEKETQAWIDSGRSPVKLLEGKQLKTILRLIDEGREDLDDDEIEFIEASQAAGRRRRQFIGGATLAATVILLVVMLFFTTEGWRRADVERAAAVTARAEEVLQKQTAIWANTLEANQRQVAETALVDAKAAQLQADQNAANADRQREIAENQQRTAEAASTKSVQQAIEANQSRATAQAANIQAQSSRLSSLSDYFRPTKLDLSLLLAIQSVQLSGNSLESRRVLLNGIQYGLESRLTRLGTTWYIDSRPFSAAFTPDGSTLAVGAGGHVYLWDVNSQALLPGPPNGFVTNSSIYAVTFDPTGRFLARGGADGRAVVWDRESNKIHTFLSFQGKYTDVTAVKFQPGGSLLAFSTGVHPDTGKGQVYLYDLQNLDVKKPVKTYHCEAFDCSQLAWSPDGTRLAIASSGGVIRVIDVANSTTMLTIQRAHNGIISGLAWYPDGKRLATCGYDQRLIQWDVNTKEIIHKAQFTRKTIPMNLTLSPDGRFFLLGLNDGPNWFGLWDAETLQKLDARAIGHSRTVSAVAFFPQGVRFVTAGYDYVINKWEYAPVDSLGILLNTATSQGLVAVSEDKSGHLIFAQNKEGGSLDLITEGGEQPVTLKVLHQSASFANIAGQQTVLLGGGRGQISFLDPATGAEVRAGLSSGVDPVRRLAVSEDGRLLAAVTCASKSACKRLVLFDLTKDEQIPLKGGLAALELEMMTSLAFSPDAKTLAIGSSMGEIYLADLGTGSTSPVVTEGLSLQKAKLAVTSLAFSTAEQGLLVAGFQDGRIALWDAGSRGPVGEFVERMNGEVTDLFFHKRDTASPWTFVSVSIQGEVREWTVDLQSWIGRACELAGRNLTAEEAAKFLPPGSPFEDVCPVKK